MTSHTLPPLKDFVVEAERKFMECRRIAQNPYGVDFPSLYLYRHMITMADGVEILCAAPNVVATIPLIRSMLEALIAIKYIHEKDYERKSRCWLYTHLDENIRFEKMLDPTTDSGREFQDVLAREIPGWESTPHDSREKTAHMRKELAKPCMVDIDKEFKRLKKEFKKKGKKGRPPWHLMFNGVSTIYEMAKAAEQLHFYRMVYGPSSRTVHARDPDATLSLQVDGSAEFMDLRDSRGLEEAREHARNLLLFATQKMVKKFRVLENNERNTRWEGSEMDR